MNSVTVKPHSPVVLVGLRWVARAASVVSIGLLAAFAFGGGEPGLPTAKEWVALAFFPVGVVAGMVLAWWKEVPGGLVTAASLAAFYGVMYAERGAVPGGPFFVLFSLPGLVLLVCGLLDRRARTA
ncbi:MAG: hypothetical protein HEQ23_10930 [Tepidisphaera sp.]